MNRHNARSTFNRAAKLYDRLRPGYPAEMVQDVITLSAIPAAGRILEIGCGTGQATMPFAARGFHMVCLDIGEDLAAIAREKVRGFPAVQVLVQSFEQWQPGRLRFDLVLAATSFHWVDPAVRYRKAASVLRPGGWLAVLANAHVGKDEGFFAEVQSVYGRCAPSMASARSPVPSRDAGPEPGMDLFGEPVRKTYPWTLEYDARAYVQLLGTYSDHIALPAAEREALFGGIRTLIDNRYGGKVLKYYEAVLEMRALRL